MISLSSVFTAHVIAEVITWVVNFLYWAALLPQVILNMRLRTLGGMSSLMLFCYVVAYILQVYYVFCLHLPLSYQVFMPAGLATVLVVIAQHVYYDRTPMSKMLCVMTMIALGLGALGIPFAFTHRSLVGNVSGWAALVVWTLHTLPQVWRMYQKRSMMGLSIGFVNIIVFGVAIELVAAIILKLPWQTRLNGIRGVIGYGLYYVMYFKFGRTSDSD